MGRLPFPTSFQLNRVFFKHRLTFSPPTLMWAMYISHLKAILKMLPLSQFKWIEQGAYLNWHQVLNKAFIFGFENIDIQRSSNFILLALSSISRLTEPMWARSSNTDGMALTHRSHWAGKYAATFWVHSPESWSNDLLFPPWSTGSFKTKVPLNKRAFMKWLFHP